MGKLLQLTDITLVGNRVTELPSEMGELTLLRSIRCDVENFTSPPPEIFAQGAEILIEYLSRLEMARESNRLVLNDFALQALPSAILSMELLESLNLDGNNIKTLPEAFTRLQASTKAEYRGAWSAARCGSGG